MRSTSTARAPPAAERGSRGNSDRSADELRRRSGTGARAGGGHRRQDAIAGRARAPLSRSHRRRPIRTCSAGARSTASAPLPLPPSARREAAQGRIRGALHGVPVAIKDIIDVEGLPTRANSRSRASAPPASNDAEIVLALKAQGAVILGKVHTTEFAFFDPSPARNPHNLAHTPGGSSSGSAAAVAAGHGAGGRRARRRWPRSTARPPIAASAPSSRARAASRRSASRRSGPPTTRRGSTAGASTTPSTCTRPSRRASLRRSPSPRASAKLAICIPEDPHISDAIPEIKAMVARLADAFAGGGSRGGAARNRRSPSSGCSRSSASTMTYEAGRALKHLLDHPAGMVGEKLTQHIRDGLTIPPGSISTSAPRSTGCARRSSAR